MTIVSVLSPKGGGGKSTVSILLAGELASTDYDTLLIDTDEDGTSIQWFDARDKQDANLTVVSLPTASTLKKSIQQLAEKHEIIIIDGAPGHGESITTSAWVSDLVIIPIKPSPNDIWKVRTTVDDLLDVREHRENIEKPGPLVYFLLNEVKSKSSLLYREAKEALELYEIPLLVPELSDRDPFANCISQGLFLREYIYGKAALNELQFLVTEVKNILEL